MAGLEAPGNIEGSTPYDILGCDGQSRCEITGKLTVECGTLGLQDMHDYRHLPFARVRICSRGSAGRGSVSAPEDQRTEASERCADQKQALVAKPGNRIPAAKGQHGETDTRCHLHHT